MFNLFPMALQSLRYSGRLNAAYFLAQKKLEELKTQAAPVAGVSSGQDGDLNWEISTQSLKIAEGANLTYAQVTITFDFQGKTQTQKFVTYLSAEL